MEKTVHIEGMRCGGCTARVTKALKAIGIEADVNLEEKTAKFAEAVASDEAVKAAIEALGFKVTEIEG